MIDEAVKRQIVGSLNSRWQTAACFVISLFGIYSAGFGIKQDAGSG